MDKYRNARFTYRDIRYEAIELSIITLLINIKKNFLDKVLDSVFGKIGSAFKNAFSSNKRGKEDYINLLDDEDDNE